MNEWTNEWKKFWLLNHVNVVRKKCCAIWPLSKIQGKKIENWASNPSFNHRFDDQSFPGLFSSCSDQIRGQRNDREDSTGIVQEWGLDYRSSGNRKSRWGSQCSGSRDRVPRARWQARLAELVSSGFSETPASCIYIQTQIHTLMHIYICKILTLKR